ncbi:MAG: PorV/PorQ family protein [Elusimicrobiota bacterium]
MKKKKRKILIAFFAASYAAAAAWVGVGILSAGRGGMPGAFLSWGAGARSLGMGKAFVSVADDASAAYWNPAGLSGLSRTELTALHTVLWAGTVYDFVSYVQPTDRGGTFGFTGTRLFLGGLEGRDNNNRRTRTFEDAQSAYGVSYGQRVLDNLSVGGGFKRMTHTLDHHTSGNYTMDLGVLYSPMEDMRLGMNIHNLFAVQFGDKSESTLPMNLRMGASYTFLRDRLTLALDAATSIHGWSMGMPLFAGMEYKATDFLDLRFGIDSEEINIGFGAIYEDYGLDYAYAAHDLGGSHRVSATVKFGESVEKLKLRKAREYAGEASAAFRAGLFKEAARNYEKAYGLAPRNKEIARGMNIMNRISQIIPARDEDTKEARLLIRALKEYIENDNTELLVLALNHILALDPSDREAERLLGLVAMIEGIEQPRIRVASGMTLAEYKLHRSLQNFYEAEYSRSIELAQDVLVIEPDNAEAYKRIGSAFYAMGNEERAAEAWEKSLEIDPDDAQLRRFLQRLGREEDSPPMEDVEEMEYE